MKTCKLVSDGVSILALALLNDVLTKCISKFSRIFFNLHFLIKILFFTFGWPGLPQTIPPDRGLHFVNLNLDWQLIRRLNFLQDLSTSVLHL